MKPSLQHTMILRACLAAVFILALRSLAFGIETDSLPWQITADSITHQQAPAAITAEGRVLLEQYREGGPTGLALEADRIQYDIDAHSVAAAGNLHLRDRYDEIRASEAQIDLAKQLGFFREATIFWQDTSLTASAGLIEKTDAKTYRFTDGRITTCPPVAGKAPDWSIWGSYVKITLDDYARLRHVTFRIRDVPVFYLPYLQVPIMTHKKSGLLFPEYSTSDRNGTGIIAPVFINLAPSYDMTLYPGYYSKRGPLLTGEFRYITGPESKGTFMFNYLDDDIVDTSEDDFKSDGLLRTNSSRYWIRGKADHDFGSRLVGRFDLDVVSDRDYLQEFKKGMVGFDQGNNDFLAKYSRGFQAETVNLRENSLQLSKIWSTTDLQAEINAVDDLRDSDDEITPPWALPRVDYSGLLPFLHTPLDLTWGSEYVYYWRDEGVGAHRVDLFPQLNGPLPFSPLIEAAYLVGLRETLYFIELHGPAAKETWGDSDYEHRTMYNALVTGATTLSRDYDLSGSQYKTFRHAIRPEISYVWQQSTDQENLPILDYEDRILEKNWVQYGLNNYFRAIRFDEVSLFRRNFSSFKINQVYDVDGGDHPFADLYFELLVRGFQDLFFRYETTVSVYGDGVTTYTLETGYKNRRGDVLNLDYRYKRHADIEPPYFFMDAPGQSLHELRANVEGRLSQLFSVKFDTTYSLSSDSTVDSTFSLVYHNPCWDIEFAAARNAGDTSFYLLLSLAGLGTPLDFALPEF